MQRMANDMQLYLRYNKEFGSKEPLEAASSPDLQANPDPAAPKSPAGEQQQDEPMPSAEGQSNPKADEDRPQVPEGMALEARSIIKGLMEKKGGQEEQGRP